MVKFWIEFSHEIRQECLKQFDLDPVAIKKAVDTGVFPETKEFKCFARCIFTNIGVFDTEGNIQFEKMESILKIMGTSLSALDDQNKCLGSTAKDVCDKVFVTTVCFYNQFKGVFDS